MRVLIVGAGLSGLTLGAFLKREKNFDVDIIEKQQDWSKPGYTLGIWDVGRRILARLGLDQDFDRLGHAVETWHFADKDLKRVMRLYHFDDFRKQYETTYTHISRTLLSGLLMDSFGGQVRMGTSITGLTQDATAVQVTFSDGSTGSYDLVIGADGLHSVVRELAFPGAWLTYTGKRAWYAWIPNEYRQERTVLEIVGRHAICNIFDDPQQACMLLTAPEPGGERDDEATRMERLKAHFRSFGEPVQSILTDLKASDLMPTDIAFVKMPSWVAGRVVVIGDAAHAMEPFGGIGASMGMEDAYVLANELSQLYDDHDVSKALARYQARRGPRVRLAEQQTRLRHRFLDSEIPGLVHLRDWIAPLVPARHFTKAYKHLLETQP